MIGGGNEMDYRIQFRRHTTLAALIMTAALLLCCQPALSAQSAGTIKTLTDSASIIRDSEVLTASVGTRVFAGDRISTSTDSYVGSTLQDDTMLTVNPHSELALTKFQFDPSSYLGEIAVSFLKGTARVVTGLIGKNSPQRVRLDTPTATIGIRGTDFVVDPEEQE
jgi:hypothetical protein